MRPTLSNRTARAQIHARLDRLSPDSIPRWGRMRAPQMICHVADHLRIALGDIGMSRARPAIRFGNRKLAVDPGLLRFKTARYLLVHLLPWPRARFEAPIEMRTTVPGKWRADIDTLHALVDRIGDRDPTEPWGSHPWFGIVSGRERGMLCWRHLDYHLRQFGV